VSKIFVQIASYRDSQLIPTIEDCLAKADKPENLIFGICWQWDKTEPRDIFDNNPQFRVSKHHYSTSRGLGWARSITNTLYDGEEYTLQIDSHHRFVKGWDTLILEDYNSALRLSKKPIITTYCTPFDPQEPESSYNPLPSLMSQYEFSADKLLMSMPWYIQDYKSRTNVIKARTLSGHFYFTSGNFIKEVPYDPDIYFGGYTEETTMSARAFTHGYDFYSPYRTIMWHEYTRNYRPKHWDDHGIESDTKKNSGVRDTLARNKTRQLFGQEEHGIVMGVYGLGTERTLHDYEVYGGFDFKKCRIHNYTLKVNEPPNPSNWEEGFIVSNYKIEEQWDVDFFKNCNFKEPKAITFGIQNSSGTELFRKDFTPITDPEIFSFTKNKCLAEFSSDSKPDKIVMYMVDGEKGWSAPYEKKIA